MIGTRGTAPALADDPYSEDILVDPYPFHDRLREAGNVVWLDRHGVFGSGRFATVRDVLRDHRRFSSAAGVGLADFRTEHPWREPSLLLEADPPEHTKARQAMTKVVSVRTLREFTAAFQAEADALVDRVLDQREIDAVTDVAEAYPLQVFADAVGIGPDDRHGLLPYGDMNFNAFGPPNELRLRSQRDAESLHAWMKRCCAAENIEPGALGARLWDQHREGELSADEASLLVRSLLTAGIDTTVSGLGNTLGLLATRPDQWDLLHQDPELARFAFDEALRLESPIQSFFRAATADTEVGSVQIPAGAKIQLFFGAANRDPSHWGADADSFDLMRDASGHLAFGMGIHHCVGQPIARLEADILLSTMARRVRRISPSGEPVRRLNNTLRGWQHLPVVLEPA